MTVIDTAYCDRLAAKDGILYFHSKENLNMNEANTGATYQVYHAGGPVIPVSKGGTGQTSLDKVIVGNANAAINAQHVNVNYKSSSNASSSVKNTTITISPDTPSSTSGTDGDIWIKF